MAGVFAFCSQRCQKLFKILTLNMYWQQNQVRYAMMAFLKNRLAILQFLFSICLLHNNTGCLHTYSKKFLDFFTVSYFGFDMTAPDVKVCNL